VVVLIEPLEQSQLRFNDPQQKGVAA
jgi:hypothetical protein